MTNIMDYLAWRSDLTFTQSPFNEIDALILARLSYVRFDGIVDEALQKQTQLQEAANTYFLHPEDARTLTPTELEDQPFLQSLAKSARFQSLKLSGYRNHLDPVAEKQFSVITIEIQPNTYYISYRGTDNSLIGWKEDFNMTYLHIIPAQRDAKQYFAEVCRTFSGSYILGGHSKGGNLAMYAALFSKPSQQTKILNVYNFDGPGFQKETVAVYKKNPLCERIHTFVPKSSIIGMLMYRDLPYTVVDSSEKGINQHDVYSWQIMGKHFIELPNLTDESMFIDTTIKTWMRQIAPAERKKFIDSMFELFENAGSTTVHGMGEAKLKSLSGMLDAYSHMDKQTRKDMSSVISILFDALGKNIKTIKASDLIHLPTKNTDTRSK
ncbi:hypothetical protein A4S06_03725 [Erysipelotrichaceae bacterium MTC7]|nr:hypothetical protein A4S06_03725 [Erysipelotrichaceae bacterium MTC7]